MNYSSGVVFTRQQWSSLALVHSSMTSKNHTGRVEFALNSSCGTSDVVGVCAAMKQTVARFGGLDILVNNAAISNERDFRRAIDVNLTAVIQSTMLSLKYMGKAAGRPGGNVINIASVAGFLPSPQVPIYTTVKHGVVGFSRALGKIAPRLYDIRVNCVCPTFVETAMLRGKGPQNLFDGQETIGQWMANMHDKIGIMSVREVAESFMKLLQNDKLSGEIMLVSTKYKGIVAMPKRLEEVTSMAKL